MILNVFYPTTLVKILKDRILSTPYGIDLAFYIGKYFLFDKCINWKVLHH